MRPTCGDSIARSHSHGPPPYSQPCASARGAGRGEKGSQSSGTLESTSKVIPPPLPRSSSSRGQGSCAEEMRAIKGLKGGVREQDQRPQGACGHVQCRAVDGGTRKGSFDIAESFSILRMEGQSVCKGD